MSLVDVATSPDLPRLHASYRRDAAQNPDSQAATLALSRPDGTTFSHSFRLLPHQAENRRRNETHLAQLLKTLLWLKGGSRIHFHGPSVLLNHLASLYQPNGPRAFDARFMGPQLCGEPLNFHHHESPDSLPPDQARPNPLGRHLDGCRIGFDLGGSDRKTAAVIDGKVVFSEEVPWDPYFQADPQYHLDGIRHSLRRAAEHLPRIDAIGGSAAGIYLNNEVRVASLFRGVTDPELYESQVRPIFKKLQAEFGGVPFEVINDGDVTALAASMNFGLNAVLGIAMGTSMAVGYCDENGQLTPGINELAFAPIDSSPEAPADEWSGDTGCGVQYFSQQAVARHARGLGFDFGPLPFPEQLIEVQNALKAGDPRAAEIYQLIGRDLAHALPHYAHYYALENLLLLGRVTSGDGGQIIIDTARETLRHEDPALLAALTFITPDETMKRHGQAIAAASLPKRHQS
ncbi:MAG: ROK family protein [Verrucomicrobiales bacterium]